MAEISAEHMQAAFEKIRDDSKGIVALPGLPSGRVLHASPEHGARINQRLADSRRALGVTDEAKDAFIKGLAGFEDSIREALSGDLSTDDPELVFYITGADLGLRAGLIARQLAEQDSSA